MFESYLKKETRFKLKKEQTINFKKTEIIKQKNKQLEKLLNIANTFTVFTSPSCFESFINLYDPNKTNIISIGDSTSSYIKSVGYSPLITSKMQTYEGISNSIISYFKNINDDISKNKA